MAFDWNKVTDAASNVFVSGINALAPQAPPTSTPAPVPGSGVAPTGGNQDAGSGVPSVGSGIPWGMVAIGVVAVIAVIVLAKRA